MSIAVYAPEGCLYVPKILAAASICGVKIGARKTFEHTPTDGQTLTMYPAIGTKHGVICGSLAALRYLANAYPASELYGRSLAEKAQVDAMLDAIHSELEIPIAAHKFGCDASKVQADVAPVCKALDKTLEDQTFLVGERMSLVDLAAAYIVDQAENRKLIDMAELPNLARLCSTVAGRSHVPLITASSSAAPQQAKGKASKKAEPKAAKAAKPAAAEENDDGEEKKAAPPKIPDPIDLLPPSDFDMDAWKRMYSNSKDLKGEAMPYLWNKFDKEGYSFWHIKYIRYNDQDNVKVFLASNLLGMFLQRIDNWLRKHMFGVCLVFEEDGYFDVEGVFFWRGQEVPKKLMEHDQYESFIWTKLDMEAQRQQITDYFCEDDFVAGRKIAGCKVYK